MVNDCRTRQFARDPMPCARQSHEVAIVRESPPDLLKRATVSLMLEQGTPTALDIINAQSSFRKLTMQGKETPDPKAMYVRIYRY